MVCYFAKVIPYNYIYFPIFDLWCHAYFIVVLALAFGLVHVYTDVGLLTSRGPPCVKVYCGDIH